MIRKIVAVWVSLAMLAGFVVIVDVVTDLTPTVKATTLYVNETGSGGAFTSIQDAINASNDGDTVFVYNGTYFEHIILNKTINLTGENKDTTIIDGSGTGVIVSIEAVWVNITGFNISNGAFGIRVISSNNNIINNNISGNGNMFESGFGIYLSSSYNNTISNNKISNTIPDQMMMFQWYGLYLSSSPYNVISNNIISNNGELFSNGYGIYLHSSSNSKIIDNEIFSNYGYGIGIWFSNNILIKGNNILNNWDGLYSYESSNINLIYNNIFNNAMGVTFYKSSNNTITNNIFVNDDILIRGTALIHFNSHTISTNNTVNGEPLYYYKDSNSIDIDGSSMSMGELILVNCTNITIRNLDINNTDVGVEIAYSSNSIIMNSNITSNEKYGIYLDSSTNINITESNLSNNYGYYNIFFSLSSYCNIIDNIISYNDGWGVRFYTSDNNTIKNNTVIDNGGGVRITWSSSYNKIIGNNVSMNAGTGIHVETSSSYNLVKNNTVLNNENGILINANTPRNNTIENNILSWNNDLGILLSNSLDSSIKNNIMESNTNYGIRLSFSNDCMISENTVINNSNYGIFVASSSNNRIFHNNFINNPIQAYDVDSSAGNQWDDGYPSGGNFWSDYSGIDSYKGPNQDIQGSDGIGDTNYSIDPDSADRYPLMKPFTNITLENYTLLKEGWNLISIPLIQQSRTLQKVLEMIDGYYDAVQFYNQTDTSDPWKHYRPGKPFGNDLFELNETMGFWIHITQPGDTIFLYNGTQPTSNQSITLHPGWNMVGYPSLSNRNRTAALNNIIFDQDVDAIWTFDAATQTWREIGPTDSFELGRGYWIHSKVTKTWDVPL